MENAKQVFNNYIKEKNIRFSRQREKILDIFLKNENHLTISEIYDLVKKIHPEIGFATVYRTIKIISDAGIAEEINAGYGPRRFEHKYGHEHHDHLICTKCGRFIEVINPEIEKLQDNMAKSHKFKVLSHKLQIFGICRECSSDKK
jgi:Fur family ferric uptake transcriptional regulator